MQRTPAIHRVEPVGAPRPGEAHRPAHRLSSRPVASRVPTPGDDRAARTVPPALHGAAAAAVTIVARAGSMATLAAMLVLGGAVAAATDGSPPPTGAVHTLQGP